MSANLNSISMQLSSSNSQKNADSTIYKKSLKNNVVLKSNTLLLQEGYSQQYLTNDNFPNLHFYSMTSTLSKDDFLKRVQRIMNAITTEMDINPLTKAVKEALTTHGHIRIYFVKHEETNAYWDLTNKIIGISDINTDPELILEQFIFELTNANNSFMNNPKTKIGNFESSTDYADHMEKAECHTYTVAVDLLFAIGIKNREKQSDKEQLEIAKTNFDAVSQGYTHYNRYVLYHNNYKIQDNQKKIVEINRAMIKIYLLTFCSQEANTYYQKLCQMHTRLTSDTQARLVVRASLQKEAAENFKKLVDENEAFIQRFEVLRPELKEDLLQMKQEHECHRRQLQMAQKTVDMNQGSSVLGYFNQFSFNIASRNTSAQTQSKVDQKNSNPNKMKRE